MEMVCHGGHFDKDAYMAEEVLRIPFAMRYDRHIPAGNVSEALITNADLAPTILAAAGTGFTNSVDGKNILTLWEKDRGKKFNGEIRYMQNPLDTTFFTGPG